jgi:3'-phosphoadenosine 5'-phosphosulfate sulfotransferase (PAPS reductase)/FAD synthetase
MYGLRVIAVSGGKDSTAMALRLAEVEPRDYTYLITPTGNELPEMFEHWARLERMLGKPFIRLKLSMGDDGLEELIEFFGALPNWRQRWCTRMLKIEPTIEWLTAHAPCVQYVGLRADEPIDLRSGIVGDFPGVTQRFPLREWGWEIDDVFRYLERRGVTIPERTDCAWCYGQRIGEWYRLWADHPALFLRGEAWEKKVGHTFRSPGRDTWPASLEGMRLEFESGRRPRGLGADRKEVCRVCSL